MNIGFKSNDRKGIKYYTIPLFEETALTVHAFTTRIGGVSKDPFKSLNFGFKTGDNEKDIFINYESICEVLDTKLEDCVLSDQVHKTNIRIVTKEDRGKGILKDRDYKEIDGLVTNESDITLFTFYADCVPLFFLDKVNKVIGLAHGGWRGTVDGIASKMIDTMTKEYNSKLKDILVAIGPSIGECCYEVGIDVYNEFDKKLLNTSKILKPVSDDKWKLNLWETNKTILEMTGIPNENIALSNICTSCNNEVFYSYRKESGITGRMAAIIRLK